MIILILGRIRLVIMIKTPLHDEVLYEALYEAYIHIQ